MSKSFAEYSATRRAGMTGADAVAVEVFDRAYALGAALAEARRERGLKQRELAELSGVDQDDIVAASGTHNFLAPYAIRADQFFYLGVRLPYAKFPRDPGVCCQ